MSALNIDTLNVDTFNNILLKAAKDTESKVKILETELEITSNIYYSEVAVLLDELDQTGYKSEQFQKIQNIKDSIVRLIEMLEELRGMAESGARNERKTDEEVSEKADK